MGYQVTGCWRKPWVGGILWLGIWSMGGGMGGAGSKAGGETPPERGPVVGSVDVATAIAQLADTSSEIRYQAEKKLLRQGPKALPLVTEALVKSRDFEQTIRLRKIATHLFIRPLNTLEGHGLLGVTLQGTQVCINPKTGEMRPGVVIVDSPQAAFTGGIVPGFPAAECVELGDRILGLDGEDLPEEQTLAYFRQQVAAHTPGQMVRLHLVRGTKELTVEVPVMGSESVESPQIGKRAEWLDQFNKNLDEASWGMGVNAQVVVLGEAVGDDQTKDRK
jgi:S1-C subfamily serine protease